MPLFVMVWRGGWKTLAQMKKSVQFKEVQHECKLTYINSIKSDEMCSKVSLSEVQIFKAERGGWFRSCRHQNSNYAQARGIYTFQSDNAKEWTIIQKSNVFATLMNPLFCGCSCFQPRFYCLSNPSWIKHAGVISAACCCIISIIHKARACNLIPSVIFMATNAGPGKVELWRHVHFRRLSVWFVARSSSILHMLFGKKKQNETKKKPIVHRLGFTLGEDWIMIST